MSVNRTARSLTRQLRRSSESSLAQIAPTRRSIRSIAVGKTSVSSSSYQPRHNRIPTIQRTAHSTTTPAQPTKSCPSCHDSIPLSASPCPNPSCRQLQPIPSNLTYYALFDLSTPLSSRPDKDLNCKEIQALDGGGFDIDPKDLRMRFLKRQQSVHPDSYSSQGEVSSLRSNRLDRFTDLASLAYLHAFPRTPRKFNR
jgi:hypothetical protein